MSTAQAQWRAFALFLTVVAVGALAVMVGSRLLGPFERPDTEIITQLKATERAGLSLPLGMGPVLTSFTHHFDRITVSVDESGKKAHAVSTLDFDGKVGATHVSSLGLEETPFVLQDGRWRPVRGDAPLLTLAVAALERRREALEAGDTTRLSALVVPSDRPRALADPALQALLSLRHRRYEARTWYLRSERDGVTVTEEYRLQGDTPDRPVDDEGRRRLWLVPVGGRLLFRRGLM